MDFCHSEWSYSEMLRVSLHILKMTGTLSSLQTFYQAPVYETQDDKKKVELLGFYPDTR